MPREPIRWDTKGLTHDDLLLTWDGELPRRPRPRGGSAAASSLPPLPPVPILPTMSTFKYHPAPKADSGFTTRVVLGPEIDETALVAAVATETGVPVDKIPLVFKAVLQHFLAAAATGGWSSGLFGIVRFRPTSGGAQSHPDNFHTPEDINADVALSFLIDAIRAWRSTLSIESAGTLGKLTPRIDTVINLSNGAVDHYTPGRAIQLVGENLRFDQTDSAQGVFLIPESGPDVRIEAYGSIEPGSVDAFIPSTVTGAQRLRVTAFINGSLRSYTYTVSIVTP